MTSTAFLHRVRLKNYRSIAACDVALGPLVFLLGPNGSGKSNFLDALRFVTDALVTSLDHAIRDRGGINDVRRRSSGHPNNFGVRLDFRTPSGSGSYAFEITARQNGAFAIKHEECFAVTPGIGSAAFVVEEGQARLQGIDVAPPPASPDRLYLVTAAGLPQFRPVFDALSHMGFYNLNPSAMRDLQSPDPGYLLKRDGSNVASCLARLEADRPDLLQRLVEYLGKVVPGVTGVQHKTLGHKETVEFRQEVHGAEHPWRFSANNMSDGTVRALGILLALHQVGNGATVPLVGIEEPETALHPAAVGVLTDSLRDAAARTQVVVTSHSPELLDDPDVPDDAIVAVLAEANETRLGQLDAAGREALRERLYTAGELLRMGQLRPDPASCQPRQLELFGDGAAG